MSEYVVVYPKDPQNAAAVANLLAEPVPLAKVPLLLGHLNERDDLQAIAASPAVGGVVTYAADLGRIVIAWDRLLALGGAAAAAITPNGWPAEDGGYPVYDAARPGEQISFDASQHYETSQGHLAAINMSLGPSDPRTPFVPFDPLNIATLTAAQETLPVVAAGNDSQRVDGRETMSAWAEAPWVVAVGATSDPQGRQLANYSSVGSPSVPESGPDLVAYGISEVDDDMPGTSFAAPKVARFAGMLASMVLTLRHEAQRATGGPVAGIPRVAVGIIDVGIHHPADPLRIPSLPSFGVNRKNLKEVVTALRKGGAELVVEPTPAILSQLLLWAAAPMSGYASFEVGAGFVSNERIEELVQALDGERFGWLFASPRPGSKALAEFRGLQLFEPGLASELVGFWQRALTVWAIDLESFELIDNDGTRHPLAQ
jgi:hypothetical protein